ncbi:hypothetical protein ACS0TY_031441 [Phlomoides rotata]
MPDFGEEFIIESYKIPWLIWIQLLVMILLVILLFFGFCIFNSDASSSSSVASASTGGGGGSSPPTHLNQPSSSQRRIKVEAQRSRRDEGATADFIREEEQSGEESSAKDSTFFRIFGQSNHPCNIFGLAKRAVFKCFGLDSSTEHSNSHQHDKQD